MYGAGERAVDAAWGDFLACPAVVLYGGFLFVWRTGRALVPPFGFCLSLLMTAGLGSVVQAVWALCTILPVPAVFLLAGLYCGWRSRLS